jgi:hypothetical protein
MKKACVVLGLLLLSAPAVFADSVPADPVFLASLGAGGACPAAMTAADKDRGGIAVKANCTANCGGGSSVSCSGTGTCVAVDRNCAAGERGYVHCSGQAVKYCPPCQCQEGATRQYPAGCCAFGEFRVVYEECINGRWEQYDEFCGGTCF